MDEQRLYDQREPIYNSLVPIQAVALKTCRGQWTIGTGGEMGSGRSMPVAGHADDNYMIIRTVIQTSVFMNIKVNSVKICFIEKKKRFFLILFFLFFNISKKNSISYHRCNTS